MSNPSDFLDGPPKPMTDEERASFLRDLYKIMTGKEWRN
jgi:hypothetical protein